MTTIDNDMSKLAKGILEMYFFKVASVLNISKLTNRLGTAFIVLNNFII